VTHALEVWAQGFVLAAVVVNALVGICEKADRYDVWAWPKYWRVELRRRRRAK